MPQIHVSCTFPLQFKFRRFSNFLTTPEFWTNPKDWQVLQKNQMI